MATGDKASAKGLRVVPATQAINQGYDAINQRGDELADEIDARTAADTSLNTNKLNATKIRVQNTTPTSPAVGDLWFADA